ncbi:hypothetical protein CcaCcLH18_08899 [Colletotrichum camelliae]|nr:hypothetical protein CcaCcLH18_08899 [Colletotrichum camelliae]
MADPLSIAASIAGLISLADVVFIRLVKFGRSVKNAEKEIQDLSKEINLLGGALNSLARLARALEDGHFDTNLRMHNIEDCSDTLKDMDKRLQKLEKSTSLTKQKLMWPFTKDRVQEWLEELSQHKANINLALSANSLDAMLRLLSQEDNHATEILAEIKETRKITSRIHQDSERQKVLEFFLKYNPQQNYDMSMHLRHPRTGLWLLRLPEFQHWISTPDSKLWLKGIPGAGKTVLAGSVIEAALERSTETTPSAFFFCDYKEAKTQVIENILGALVYQLAIQKEDAYIMLERYYSELHPNNGLPKQPNRKGLQKLLRKILELFDHIYLIIDGLDECSESTDEVVESLSSISEDADNVSIALLSRDEDEIRSRLEGEFTPIEIAAHKGDITEYVTAEIEERIRTEKLRIDSLDLKKDILEGLVDGAKGMFRWVACQLDHLGDCDSDQQCRDALKSLPETLDETYERILRRVPKSKQSLTELALNCIAHASPKLSIHEMREMLSVPASGVVLNTGAVIREESITRYCSSMIRKSTDGLHLEFSHFSVQEFLEKSSTQREWLRVSKPRAYALLAVQCLKFIQLQNFNRTNIKAETEEDQIESRNHLHPLYSHASINWPIYARGEWEKETVFDLAVSLFHPSKTPYFTSWAVQLATGIKAYPPVDIEKTVSLLVHPDFTPLHMAAALSLPRMCSFLLENGLRVTMALIQEGARLEEADSLVMEQRLKRLPLRGFQPEIREFLEFLNNCANQSTANHRMSAVLWGFAVKSKFNFTKDPTIIDTKLSLTTDELGKHAMAAITAANTQLLGKILSDPRFKVASFADEDGNSLLHLALRRYHGATLKSLGVVLLLLDAECDVSRTNRMGLDPLQSWNWAAYDDENLTADELESFDQAAHLLADHGARCDLQDPENRTALHLNIDQSCRLRALLKYQPAESVKKAMETVDNDGYTPLTLSLQKMHVRSASILLAQQTTITAKMAQSPVPVLSLAIRAGDEHLFDSLMLSGVKSISEGTKTPLHYFGPQTSVQFVRRLKTLYTEDYTQHSNGYTPLESYLASCLEIDGVRNINDLVIDELSILDTPRSEMSKAATWECFTSRILSSAMQLPISRTGVFTDDEKDDRQLVAEASGISLIRLGYLQSFESCFKKSGIIPLMQSFSSSLGLPDLWLRLRDLCFEILRQTQHWESVRESSSIILILKASVQPFDAKLVELLLENGISVHQRVDETSALESIVLRANSDLYASSYELDREKESLDLVLGYSDRSRLNEVIPDGNGLALIHLPMSWNAAWIIKKLVNHGADPNLRISKEPYMPASVHHMVESRTDLAKAIFNNGADPTLTDDHGCDTALVAAFRDGVSLLTEIHSDIKYGVKKDWHDKMDWHRKCVVRLDLGEDWQSCTGATALHLGATSISTDILRFYIDQKLIEDVNVRSHEGHTPLHFAASAGSVDNIEYLSAHGCDVNARARDGSSPLHIAARNNAVKAAKALIKAGCRSSIDSAGMTPAIYAHQASNRELSALLDSIQLDSGAVGGKSPEQQTAGHHGRPQDKTLALAFRNAIAMDGLALCQSLHANGCDLTTSLNGCAGGTLISEAITLKRVTIIEWMLQQRVSMTTAVSDTKPVELAIHLVLKDTDLVDILPASLENYAQNGGRLLGETPCMANTAVLGNNIKGLEILLQYAKENKGYYGSLWSMHPDKVVSALVNEVDSSTGWTPLHEAAGCGSLETVQILLQSGADLNALHPEHFQTPLRQAILSDDDIEEAVALYLIQEGADLEQRDAWGDTPAIDAANYKRTRTLSALISANLDINVMDSYHRTLLHLLVNKGSVMAFADLIHRGADPHKGDVAGCSAFHKAIEDASFIPFLLNSNIRFEDATPFSWMSTSNSQIAWITTAYPLFRKRYGFRALGQLANVVPAGIQAPLCEAVKRGSVPATKNLLDLGAPIDLEGCPSGSALMAACEFGRKDLVKYLVRRGASLSYTGSNGFRSAYKSAKGQEEILKWLLVDRFFDQQKLTNGFDSSPHDEVDLGPFFWSGPIKAELVISGQMERLPHQSSREYWSWLMKEKVKWRGKTLPPNTRRRTVSPSNIVPQETVRIHTQGYNFNGQEGNWFSKKMPKIQSDGECWYVSYIDTP